MVYTKVLDSSQKSEPVFWSNFIAFSTIIYYLKIFKMLYIFIIQISKNLFFSKNNYNLERIFYFLEELQTTKNRVNMKDLKCLSSFFPMKLFFYELLINKV